MNKGTIAVDLDGTLAEYYGWKGPTNIGPIIPEMHDRIKKWLKEGRKVVIFTARIHNNKTAKKYLRNWLDMHKLHAVGITNIKTPDIIEFWDDRAVRVGFNTGECLSVK